MKFIKAAYRELIVDHKRDAHFWMFISFLCTFIFLRILVYLVVFGPPHLFIDIRGTHVHHMTIGIFLLSIVGYISLTSESKGSFRPVLSFLFGIALALVFDEFGMWLKLSEEYWTRESYDLILVISVWFVNTVYFSDFWVKIFTHVVKKIARK
ncbi:MAG: hypothetical protein M1450_05395 [Patescibacteria group bacterium]|nr:hypothetical protein [Patescibacteria group bacterium]